MKTFKSYIIENTITPMETKLVEEFIFLVNKNCKPWLKAVKNCSPAAVWRGLMHAPDPIINKNVRADRKPRDTVYSISQRWDSAFNIVFGWPARSASLFVSGDFSTARIYGAPYSVFPRGKFSYIWSKTILDLSSSTFSPIKNGSGETSSKELTKWVEQRYTKNDSLCSAIKSGNEIMIKCESYYGIKYDILDKYITFLGNYPPEQSGTKFIKDAIF